MIDSFAKKKPTLRFKRFKYLGCSDSTFHRVTVSVFDILRGWAWDPEDRHWLASSSIGSISYVETFEELSSTWSTLSTNEKAVVDAIVTGVVFSVISPKRARLRYG